MVITLYQHDILWADPEANRRRVEAEMASLPADTDIFVVPETFTTGFGDHMAALAEAPDGPTLQWAQNMAAQHDLLFVGTWIVREGDCCYNRLHWVFPDGGVGSADNRQSGLLTGNYGFYDKAHTFRPSGEHNQIARGTERVVFEYKGWRIKPAVCYDLRFPTWLRNEPSASPSSAMQYDLLLVCANWPGSRHEAWTTLLKARAIENLCYVAGCNRMGLDGHDGEYSGHSTIIDYKGFAIAQTTTCETISATLDKKRLDDFRQKWPLYLDFDQHLS